MGLKLFHDDPSDEDEKLNQIEINKEFARRYEHNKKREDLQRLEELKKKGVISDEDDLDSSESSKGEVEDLKKKDLKFFDVLIKVRNKDPVLKNKNAKLFESDDEDVGQSEDGDSDEEKKCEEKNGNNEKKKPMYLKDVVSKHLIEEGPEFDDCEDDEENNDKNMLGQKEVKSYLEEQEELRKKFLEAMEEVEAGQQDGGELLKEKNKKDVDEDDDFGIGNKLDEYFGTDEKLDADSLFLKDYFRNRLWVGEGGQKSGAVNEEGIELGFSEEEEEIEKQEDYEREYNFRFEENAGDRVMGHSRVVEGSVRKKTNARKSQRERKEERKEQAEFERKEELKHLKNLKKKEMREKLQKIKEAAGIGDIGACLFDEDDLEEEFDSEEYDKKMKQAFDNEYYEADDVDSKFGSDKEEDGEESEKPDFDKEDELLGLHKGWDDANESGDGFLSFRKRILQMKAENEGNNEQVEQNEDETVGQEDSKRKRKRKQHPSEVEKAVRDQLLEEYYKLDYEDTVGDLKTRFKYKAVNPKRYGLTAEEILGLDDKELNQYVPLKKLAPYREKEWKVPRIKTFQQKQRNKELLQEEASNIQKYHKKVKGIQDKQSSILRNAESEKPKTEDMNDDKHNLSRKSKRRHRKAELKLPNSRLMAYQKIPSKAKNKKKS